MKLIAVDLLIYLLLSVTSADLLYLYFNGNWGDPNPFIEVFEVGALVVFVIIGIGRFILKVRRG